MTKASLVVALLPGCVRPWRASWRARRGVSRRDAKAQRNAEKKEKRWMGRGSPEAVDRPQKTMACPTGLRTAKNRFHAKAQRRKEEQEGAMCVMGAPRCEP